MSMKKSEIEALGFTIEKLPSGNHNLCHKDRFVVNDFTTIVKKDGLWIKTFQKTNIQDVYDNIKTINFMV